MKQAKLQHTTEIYNIHNDYKSQLLSLESTYKLRIKDLENKNEGLGKDKDKLINELKQVKMIMRSPYLHQKYKSGKFSNFKDLDVCKFTPPLEKSRNHLKSASLDKIDNDQLQTECNISISN